MSKGFNLIGYATSPLGLGEDLRSFASILEFLGIPFSVTDLPTESSGKVPYHWKCLTTEDYDNSIFFMSPMGCRDLHRVFPELFEKPKTTIGYFLWELPDLPEEFIPSLHLVKHIWCPTKFVQKAFMAKSRQLTLCIPLPVNQVQGAGFDFRENLNIPDDAFVCLYMFDLHSTINRKNPQATTAAFLEFAKNKPDVFLTLKINRWQGRNPKELAWLPQHPQIKIITDTLMSHHIVDLYQSANCYLSLHRSEGFGRTLVEALQNNLALITTNYSGPADFVNANNAYLVEWAPRKVLPGEYPHSKGSIWCEPDIASAVRQLEAVYQGPHSAVTAQGLATGNSFKTKLLAQRYKPIIQSYLL